MTVSTCSLGRCWVRMVPPPRMDSLLSAPIRWRMAKQHNRAAQLIEVVLRRSSEQVELLPLVGGHDSRLCRLSISFTAPVIRTSGYATVLPGALQACVDDIVA